MTGPFRDAVSLMGMRFEARHGVHAHEKQRAQPFEVDVVLGADLSRAAATDDLAATVDYAALHELVRAIITGPSFDLVEALAGAVARAVLAATDPAVVDSVEVRVRKPDALPDDPVVPQVTLRRERSTG